MEGSPSLQSRQSWQKGELQSLKIKQNYQRNKINLHKLSKFKKKKRKWRHHPSVAERAGSVLFWPEPEPPAQVPAFSVCEFKILVSCWILERTKIIKEKTLQDGIGTSPGATKNSWKKM